LSIGFRNGKERKPRRRSILFVHLEPMWPTDLWWWLAAVWPVAPFRQSGRNSRAGPYPRLIVCGFLRMTSSHCEKLVLLLWAVARDWRPGTHELRKASQEALDHGSQALLCQYLPNCHFEVQLLVLLLVLLNSTKGIYTYDQLVEHLV
jgi:hypothetical protein